MANYRKETQDRGPKMPKQSDPGNCGDWERESQREWWKFTVIASVIASILDEHRSHLGLGESKRHPPHKWKSTWKYYLLSQYKMLQLYPQTCLSAEQPFFRFEYWFIESSKGTRTYYFRLSYHLIKFIHKSKFTLFYSLPSLIMRQSRKNVYLQKSGMHLSALLYN